MGRYDRLSGFVARIHERLVETVEFVHLLARIREGGRVQHGVAGRLIRRGGDRRLLMGKRASMPLLVRTLAPVPQIGKRRESAL